MRLGGFRWRIAELTEGLDESAVLFTLSTEQKTKAPCNALPRLRVVSLAEKLVLSSRTF
jgi:hypothetical protein